MVEKQAKVSTNTEDKTMLLFGINAHVHDIYMDSCTVALPTIALSLVHTHVHLCLVSSPWPIRIVYVIGFYSIKGLASISALLNEMLDVSPTLLYQ